jgi:hypothetical protein
MSRDHRGHGWVRRAGRVGAPSAILLGLTLGAAALAQDAIPPAAAGSPTVLAPGRQTSDVLGPVVSFTVGEGWWALPVLEGPILTYERVDTPGGVLTLTRFDGAVFTESCDSTSLTMVEPTAARLIEVIAGSPWLEVQAGVVEGEVGGLAAHSLDVVTPQLAPDECSLPYLLIWAIDMEDGQFVQVPGQASRFIGVDVGPDTLVIAIETLPGVPFEAFASEAMRLVSTMSFEGG